MCSAPQGGVKREASGGERLEKIGGAWSAMQIENPPITRKRTQPNTLPFN